MGPPSGAKSTQTVLLIHGLAGSSKTWDAVMPLLAERYDVIAPDLLGHGESAKPLGDYSLGAFASDYLAESLPNRFSFIVRDTGFQPVRTLNVFQPPTRECFKIGIESNNFSLHVQQQYDPLGCVDQTLTQLMFRPQGFGDLNAFGNV